MRLNEWLERRRARLDIAIFQVDNLGWHCTVGGRPLTQDWPATSILSAENEPVVVQGFGTTPDQAYARTVTNLAGTHTRLSITGHGREETVRIPQTLIS